MKLKTVLNILFIIICFTSTAQIGQFQGDDLKFSIRIKNFDEFIERFNFQFPMQIEKDGHFERDSITRKQFLETIFLKKISDNDTLNSISKIIDTIVTSNIQLNPYDSNLYVSGNFQCVIQNKTELLPIVLKPVLQGKGYKWAIENFSDKFISDLSIPAINDSIYINPTNNDLYFNQIPKFINANEFDNIVTDNLLYDRELLFYRGLKSGEIKIGSCRQMDYYLFHIPNWVLKVSLVNDDEKLQTGWLITDIFQVQESQKSNFFNEFIF